MPGRARACPHLRRFPPERRPDRGGSIWVAAAGRKPEEIVAWNPERFPLPHIQDSAKGEDGKMLLLTLGRGTVDYRPTLRPTAGLKRHYAEQKESPTDPIDADRAGAVSL